MDLSFTKVAWHLVAQILELMPAGLLAAAANLRFRALHSTKVDKASGLRGDQTIRLTPTPWPAWNSVASPWRPSSPNSPAGPLVLLRKEPRDWGTTAPAEGATSPAAGLSPSPTS